jgi:hypothetical protein
MEENHQREQYWFDEPTLARLGQLIWQYDHAIALCCPRLGEYMAEERKVRPPTVLDIDERFEGAPWFKTWDIHHPEPLSYKPKLIVFDPPFKTIKLDRLFAALRVLTHGDFTVPLVIAWLKRNEGALLGTLSAYGLQSTGLKPGYVSCSPDAEFYANFDLRGSLCLGPEDAL